MRASPLRIGIIGCGEVCEHKHMRALQRLTTGKVVAVSDVKPERSRHVADRYSVPLVFDSSLELVKSGEVDVVGVLTPPGQHLEPALMALEQGCHVLIEKPIALSLDDADQLVDASTRHTARAVMGFHMRWHRLIARARQLLDGGKLGTVESIHAIWNSPRGHEGTVEWMRRRHTGGGSLVELGVHLYDLWRHLTDSEVIEVFARSKHGSRDDETSVVSAVLADGSLASAQMSEQTGHELQVEVCGSEQRLRVSGVRFDGFHLYRRKETPGMVKPRIRQLGQFARDLPRGLSGMRRVGDYGDSYLREWLHVLEVASGSTPVECTLDDGRNALRVALAATASAARGEPVSLADAPRSIPAVVSQS